MRGEYFQNLPLIDYNDRQMRNILLRAVASTNMLTRASSYYPYVINEGDTPSTIAHDYYGSVAYDWVVLLSNTIIDPYHQWPLTAEQLDGMIAKKYGSVEEAQQRILVYRKEGQKYPYMTPTTWTFSSPTEREGFRPVYAYDHEVQMNEERRRIKLIDNAYLPILERQVQTVFTQPRRASRIQRASPEIN